MSRQTRRVLRGRKRIIVILRVIAVLAVIVVLNAVYSTGGNSEQGRPQEPQPGTAARR